MKEIDLTKVNIDDLDVAPINIKILLELHNIIKEKKEVVRNQNYVGAAELRDREIHLLKKLEEETGVRYTGYQNDDIIEKIRQLKLKFLLDE